MKPLVDASEFNEAADELGRFGPELGKVAGDTIDDMAGAVLVNVRRRRARHHVTGKGERMITVRASGSGAHREARVHAGGKVARILVGGSRAHVIRPAAGHALRMTGPARGFAAAVRHPGTRPDPFVAEGVDDSRARIDTITDQAGAELVAELAHEIGGG